MARGAIGPGKLLEQLLGADAKIVGTLICGDNYAVENQDAMIAAALEQFAARRRIFWSPVRAFSPAVTAWPPARFVRPFKRKLEIPVITGMAPENPGTDLYREALYIVDSGDNAAKMRDVFWAQWQHLASKLVRKELIGSTER